MRKIILALALLALPCCHARAACSPEGAFNNGGVDVWSCIYTANALPAAGGSYATPVPLEAPVEGQETGDNINDETWYMTVNWSENVDGGSALISGSSSTSGYNNYGISLDATGTGSTSVYSAGSHYATVENDTTGSTSLYSGGTVDYAETYSFTITG